jgi:hypothetical protein
LLSAPPLLAAAPGATLGLGAGAPEDALGTGAGAPADARGAGAGAEDDEGFGAGADEAEGFGAGAVPAEGLPGLGGAVLPAASGAFSVGFAFGFGGGGSFTLAFFVVCTSAFFSDSFAFGLTRTIVVSRLPPLPGLEPGALAPDLSGRAPSAIRRLNISASSSETLLLAIVASMPRA